ncbi:ABC-type transport system, involved in lipoprotein release, permease component [Nitrosospira sp. Nsp11]|uniref:ABC transporter permease n=1 Tax=Nitrosospira sp. Nsp11 TaxID=1855338 RepID=UPI00091A5AAC|nr:ABC transporter permease [Nitrosospira sp. Nsp11]SHL78163.1 ABC-type transport system, involved in lipoprotein release, permease component [Nitrosospira sp. Nsp11]
MSIPLSYTWRNLAARKLTTLLTACGMALVVFVFATVLMLEEGLRRTMVDTGSPDNVIVTRRSAGTEVQSLVERDQAAIVENQPEVAYGINGARLASKETIVLIALAKRDSNKASNVLIRGVGQKGIELRPQVEIMEGRMFHPGSTEIIAGKNIAERYKGAGVGETLRFAQREWTVVGIMDAGKSGFDSEIWGDVDQLMQAFRRPVYSSVILKLNDAATFPELKSRIENDPRLTLEAKRESVFYAEQSQVLANFIRYLGMMLSIIFSAGAIIGAMITMYASVANRATEIGTLRALGFRRRNILSAFLVEALMLGATGGVIGLTMASFMQFFTISTMNWQSFSELAFSFILNLEIILKSFAFALIMGVVGGVLPAARAARLKIVDSLRAV